MSSKVTNIVFTGGPGGGKSTCIEEVKSTLESLGFLVIVINETASEVMETGILPYGPTAIDSYEFQKIIVSRQLEKEKEAREQASASDKPVVILHDRSLVDNKAYLDQNLWPKLLEEFHLTEREVMERYDLVVNLTSTAVDKPDIYEKIRANNQNRSEDITQASEKDKITLEGYVAHHNLRIVGNSTDFEEKIRRVIECILIFLNIPFHFNNQFKYLVDLNKSNLEILDRLSTKAHIEQTYLAAPEGLDIKVRKTTINGESSYYLIIKRKEMAREEIIVNKTISKSEYDTYLTEKDRNLGTIVKTRYSFIYNNEKWTLDIFPDSNTAILENETTADKSILVLPEFLGIIGERNDIKNHEVASYGLQLVVDNKVPTPKSNINPQVRTRIPLVA